MGKSASRGTRQYLGKENIRCSHGRWTGRRSGQGDAPNPESGNPTKTVLLLTHGDSRRGRRGRRVASLRRFVLNGRGGPPLQKQAAYRLRRPNVAGGWPTSVGAYVGGNSRSRLVATTETHYAGATTYVGRTMIATVRETITSGEEIAQKETIIK